MNIMDAKHFNQYKSEKLLEFYGLRLTDVDKGMIAPLATLNKQDDIVPIFSCEGHFTETVLSEPVDSYLTFLCSDANKVTKVYDKLIKSYVSKLGLEDSVGWPYLPTMDYAYLLREIDGSVEWYPSFTFRVWLLSKADQKAWLEALTECFK